MSETGRSQFWRLFGDDGKIEAIATFELLSSGDLKVSITKFKPDADFPGNSEVHLSDVTFSAAGGQPRALLDWMKGVVY